MRLAALYVLDNNAFEMVYPPGIRSRVAQMVDVYAPHHTAKEILLKPELLSRVQVLLSGWGSPRLDAALLKAAPRLKAVFFGAGSVSQLVTPATWERGILVTSAAAANAIPVAEYTLATILFSLKHGWRLARQTREQRDFPGRDGAPGAWKRKVGLVSLGVIARTLLRLLKPFDLEVFAYDPYVTSAEASELGVKMVSLTELFSACHVVSIHSPLLPETTGLVTGELIASMRQGATLINTARGPVVREREMIEVATRREDLQFVLDVADREPPVSDSALYTLANVVLTPHIAGSVGQECARMGEFAVDELERYVNGQPLQCAVNPELLTRTSHGALKVFVKAPKPKAAASLPMSVS